MLNRKFVAAVALCATATVGLTACGGDKKNGGADGKTSASPSASPSPTKPPEPFAGLTADEIADKALDTTKAADSLNAKGEGTIDGGTASFDVVISQKGDCDGTINADGATIGLREVDDQPYMKADATFWKKTLREDGASKEEADAAAELFKGRWMKIPAEAEADGMTAPCDADSLLEDAKENKRGLTKGTATKVGGKTALMLTKKDGDKAVTYYVATEGEPYLLKFSIEGGKEPGSIELSDFNTQITVTAPSPDEIVDPEKLGA